MGVNFTYPLLLLLLPAALAAVLLLARGTRIRRSALIMRVVAVSILVLSIAGMQMLLPGGRGATYFLADVSASTRGSKIEMEEFVANALRSKPEKEQAGVISFGRNSMIETPLNTSPAFSSFQTAPDMEFTDIAQALAMGAALMPDGSKRVVLLSDGRQNLGDALKAAELLSLQNVRLDAALFDHGGSEGADAQISSVSLPSYLYQDEAFDVRVRVDATQAMQGTLRLLMGKEQVASQEVSLLAGENNFVFRLTAKTPGVQSFEAVIDAQGDATARNDRNSASTMVRGESVILLVEGKDGEARELSKMLTAQGMKTIVRKPAALPDNLEGLRSYQAVVLVNVSSDDVSEACQSALEDYVSKLGRGLLMTGGDQSFAMGGWKETPVERALPVTMDVKGQVDAPALALMLVIDHSGSMTEGQYGISKLDMAVEAAIRSLEAVRPGKDEIGVIAFDDQPAWVLELAVMDDLEVAAEKIGTIRPGGGTMMYSPLKEAMLALKDSNARTKHIIVLTDGMPADTGFEELVVEMGEYGITLSSVAVGQGADGRLLKNLSDLGQGRFYLCDVFSDIPKVFTRETYLATGAYLQNRVFTPLVADSSAVIDAFSGFPRLEGYLGTTKKPTASAPLISDTYEPVYAAWQYGLGRAAVWTSDTNGALSADWLSWREAARFFAGIVSDILPAEDAGGRIESAIVGDEGTVSVEWDDGIMREATARVIAPDGTEQEVQLRDVSPGKKEAVFDAAQEGAYIVQVDSSSDGQSEGTLETGVSRSWSPEYDLRTTDAAALLEALVKKTGGELFTSPEQVFASKTARSVSRADLSGALLIIAFLLFLFDVAQRRLELFRRMGVVFGRAGAEAGAMLATVSERRRKAGIERLSRRNEERATMPKDTVEMPKAEAPQKPKQSDAPALSGELLKMRREQTKKWK